MPIPMTSPVPPALLVAASAVSALALPMPASATCALAFAPAVLDLGARQRGAVQPSEVAGWRQLGQGAGTLTGRCDVAQATVRLSLTDLVAAGSGLLRWQSAAAPAAGALRLRLEQARVGDSAVKLLVEGSGRSAAGSVDVDRNAAVVRFDLPAAVPANTVFSVRFSVLGLVSDGFSPTGATTFSLAPVVELLP